MGNYLSVATAKMRPCNALPVHCLSPPSSLRIEHQAGNLLPGLFDIVLRDTDERNAGGTRRLLVFLVVADADEDGVLPGQAGDDFGLVQVGRLPVGTEVQVA